MNKYQFRTVLVAILAIVASVVLWTSAISSVSLPQISQEVVTQFDDYLRTFFKADSQKKEVSVTEVTIEDLGTHFARSVDQTHVTASVIEHSQKVTAEEATVEVVDGDTGGDLVEPPVVIHPSASELDQWDISRAWSIAIPSLGIRAPVLLPSMKNWSSRAWDVLEEQMQVGLNHGAVAYPHSSGPGRKGNLIIAGHSSPPTESARNSEFGSLFSQLPNIEVGEEISIVTAGSPVTYRVEKKTIVSPQTTSILEQQQDESILKLITCYPVGTTRDRMNILAKKIED